MTDRRMGMWYEELPVGTVVEHAITRTLTETDNVLFTTMSMNPQPLHLDHRVNHGDSENLVLLADGSLLSNLADLGGYIQKLWNTFSAVWMLFANGLPSLAPTPPPSLRAYSASIRSR